MITVSALLTTMLVSYVLPAIVSVVTKLDASAWFKQGINALLSAITGLFTTAVAIDGTAVLSRDALLLALGSFLVSQAAYITIYASHQANARIMPMSGLG